jgi:hypothetical protein
VGAGRETAHGRCGQNWGTVGQAPCVGQRICSGGPWARPSWVASGRCKPELGPTVVGGLSFWFPPPPPPQLFTGFYKYSNQIKHVTSEKGTSIAPKMSKFDMMEAKIKRNNFPFGEKFKFQMDFEIKIHE